MKYLVIGTGRMAAGIIFDLIHYGNATKIVCCDQSEVALEEMQKRFNKKSVPIEYRNTTAEDKSGLVPIMNEVDGVISAVPYDYNYDLLPSDHGTI